MYDTGSRIRELRLKKGLSQNQLAKKLNTDKSVISRYESNQSIPNSEVLSNLALIFNTSSDYILGLNTRKFILVEGLTDNQIDVIKALVLEIKYANERHPFSINKK